MIRGIGIVYFGRNETEGESRPEETALDNENGSIVFSKCPKRAK